MDYTKIPPQDVINKTAEAVKAQNVNVYQVDSKEEALAKLKELLPAGAEIMTASSTTLDQIGFVDILKSKNHPWKNLKDAIVAEKDPAKQAALRKQSLTSEYFLGSVHAVTQQGELVVASASGSQIPGYAFASDNVIWVAGAHKIVPTLQDAFERIEKHTVPLEDKRMKSVGMSGTKWSHTYVFKYNIMPRKLHLILVKEALGF
jgi:L-lactate utilization protein LutC